VAAGEIEHAVALPQAEQARDEQRLGAREPRSQEIRRGLEVEVAVVGVGPVRQNRPSSR